MGQMQASQVYMTRSYNNGAISFDEKYGGPPVTYVIQRGGYTASKSAASRIQIVSIREARGYKYRSRRISRRKIYHLATIRSFVATHMRNLYSRLVFVIAILEAPERNALVTRNNLYNYPTRISVLPID